MFQIIYKSQIQAVECFSLWLPIDAKILCVQAQYEIPCIWYIFDSGETSTEERKFKLVGTGNVITEEENMEYIGTFQLREGTCVGHLFEIKEAA